MFRTSFVSLLLLPVLAAGQENQTAIPWRDLAKRHLKPAQVDVLARQKVIVGDQTYRQAFTPYLYGDMPVFVTTDSLLNGFHVLLEESIYRLERANAAYLPALLDYASGRLDQAAEGIAADPLLLAAAKKRAKIFLGTAVRLNNDGAKSFDEATDRLIRAEVGRVIAATEVSKPPWLGPKDPGLIALDYTRFRPRGFYTRSTQLESYFRVVNWLQAIPFRIKKDEELLAALILSRSLDVPSDHPKSTALRQGWRVLRYFGEWLGCGDDWGLDILEHYHPEIKRGGGNSENGKSIVNQIRAELQQRAKEEARPQINDHLAFIPDDPAAVAEVSIRVVPAYRLPDAVLFQRITDPRRMKRPWPSGLDVAAALGSDTARRYLVQTSGKGLVSLIDANLGLFNSPRVREDFEFDFPTVHLSLYAQYLGCLRTLATTTEPDWPPFMKGEAWQAKTCQTVLDGWSQMRHTWVLQTKLNVNYAAGGPGIRPGFVEPVPEFYRAMTRLCERIESLLSGTDAFADEAGSVALAQRWRKLRECCARLECLSHKQLRGREFAPEESAVLKQYGKSLSWLMFYEGNSYLTPRDDAPRIVDVFANGGSFLEVGIGKPRAIYVLYPWQGKEVLCRGVVLPYHEIRHGQRLTDEAWQKLLQSPDSVAPLSWTKILTDGLNQ